MRSARPNRCGSERASAAGARRTTPLHLAAWNGNADATAALLGAGADASIKESSGYAALSRAARPTATNQIRRARRRTAERWAQRNGESGAYAAAVEQARGCAARHRLPHAGVGLRSHSFPHLARARHGVARRNCTVGRALLHLPDHP